MCVQSLKRCIETTAAVWRVGFELTTSAAFVPGVDEDQPLVGRARAARPVDDECEPAAVGSAGADAYSFSRRSPEPARHCSPDGGELRRVEGDRLDVGRGGEATGGALWRKAEL
jgi:hypothetical protein